MTEGPSNGRAALEGLLSMRLAIVTGKGGVGKTTVAAALARIAATSGRRVLAAETGLEPGTPSPLLTALAGEPRASSVEPVEVAPRIDHVLLTPSAGHRAFLRDVLPMGFLADRALRAEPIRRFLSAAPAFAELGILYRGQQLLEEERRKGQPRWDVMVLDAPATGHAIAFASLPAVVLRIIPGGPIGRAVKKGLAMLNDPARTRALVVTLPEALPVSEAIELADGLATHHVRVEALLANQVPLDPFSAPERVALHDWLGQGDGGLEAVLGGRTVSRLGRAAAALERLRGEAVTLLTVGEHLLRGPPLVDAVAAEMLGGR